MSHRNRATLNITNVHTNSLGQGPVKDREDAQIILMHFTLNFLITSYQKLR